MRFQNKTLEQNLCTAVPDWYNYNMTIETEGGPVDLSWEYAGDLAFFTMFQIGSGNHGPPRIQTLYDHHNRLRQEEWTRIENLFDLSGYELPVNANILDIGCGVGINDMILSSILPTASFTLADRNEWSQVGTKTREFMNGYNEEYIFYNCWNVFEDGVKNSGLKRERFKLIDPDDEWEKYDMIISTWSWGWHYPLSTYWDRAVESLKPGGFLVIDLAKEEDVTLITETMGSDPINLDYRYIWRKNG